MERGWKIALLGGLRATRGSDVIERFATQKSAGLIAFLAVSGRSHRRDELVELLWPDVDPAISRLRLNQVLSSLRRQFKQAATQAEGLILADRWEVGLNPKAFETDIAEFERLAKSDEELPRAMELYRGELLPGVQEEWAIGERNRLTAQYASVLERLRRHYRREGKLDEAVAVAVKLVALDPFHEEGHLGLIRLYGLQGRVSLAIDQYERMEAALEELGEQPSEAARRIIDRIRKGDVPTVERPEPPSARPAVPREKAVGRTHLPVRLSRFFGREEELAAVAALLSEDQLRLVTLTGPGGIGKTQLALETAYRADGSFGAIHFAPLAPISKAEEIVEALYAALNQSSGKNETGMAGVAAILRRWERSLLVLDNFEHLPEAAPIVEDLLGKVPGLVILATSRSPLGLPGERRFEVGPLAFATADASLEDTLAFPSTQLFLERARETRADFALTPRNREAIQTVCARLEGLPLALELAAGWASTMSPSQMLKGLEDRFQFLKNRRRPPTERHGSLYAAIDYGFALLDERSQHLLVAFSIFQGGFTDEAAQAMVQLPSIFDCIAELVERSMIKAEPDADHSSVRYSMLESIREYGLGRLTKPEIDRLRHRHAHYFARISETAQRERNGPEQVNWLRRLTEDHRNLISALEWLEKEDPETGLRMACALDWYWEAKGHLATGRGFIERTLRERNVPALLKGQALNGLTWLVWNQNRLEEARGLGEEARNVWVELDSPLGLQQAEYNLGVIAFRRQDFESARHFLGEALRLAEESDDLSGVSRALMLFGNVARVEGDPTAAKTFYQRSLQMELQTGNSMRACFALSNLGGVAVDEGELDLAAGYYERSVVLAGETGHRSYQGVFLYNLGTTRTRQGRFNEARQALREALTILVDASRDHLIFRLLWDIAALASKIPDLEAAATFWGIASSMVERVPVEPADPENLARDEENALTESLRASSAYKVARAFGGTMRTSEAEAFAFDWLATAV